MDTYHKKEFERIASEMVEFLNNNGHPHMTVVVTQTGAELCEGLIAVPRRDNEGSELFSGTRDSLSKLTLVKCGTSMSMAPAPTGEG